MNRNEKRNAERERIYKLDTAKWYFENMHKRENPYIHLQGHNSKLQPTEKIAFLIFSLPAVLTCPNATAHCMKACYARRDERRDTVKVSRIDNFILSMRDDFVELVTNAIHNAMYCKNGKIRKPFEGKKVVFRLHESGDFYNVAYMKKWFQIARRFPNIQFFTYTKSFDLLKKCIDEKPENFFIRGSVWDDTTEEEKAIIEKLALTTYTAAETVTNVPKRNICDCKEGCGGCGCKCAFLKENIVTEIH